MADGRLVACEVNGPLQSRENSRLFYAQCGGVPGPMAVKVCLTPRTAQVDPGAARRQFDTLVRVHEVMGQQEELSVPRPYVLVADAGLLGTEWVAGESMTRLLFSWRCSSMKARGLVGRAARWLKRFHECHELPPGRLGVEEKLAFLSTLDGASLGEPFHLAFECLRGSARAAGEVAVARSWVHGDFTADNLMVAGSRTLGIDIEARYENAVIHDLAPFLNYLELRALHPSGWRRSGSREGLGRAFLDTYLGGASSRIGVPLAWLRLYLLLQGWTTARGNKAAMRLRFIDLCYSRVTSRLVEALGTV